MHADLPIPSLDDTIGTSAIALDFETASTAPGGICALGLAWIRDGAVSHVAHRLVRPHDMRFDAMNVRIHGIRPEHVEAAPEFPAVWDELRPHLDGPLLLAHNAPFDIGVLRAALAFHDLPWPSLSFACTVQLARAAWPELPNHKLGTVAAHIGFDLRHHAADSDAAACAEIALRAAGDAPLDAALAQFGIQPGRLEPGYHQACTSAFQRRSAWRRSRPPPWLR